MGRQILFLVLLCAAFAFLLKGVQRDFLDIWLQTKSAGEFNAKAYDAAWAQYILPRIALFVLLLLPIAVGGSLMADRKAARYPTRLKQLFSWIGH